MNKKAKQITFGQHGNWYVSTRGKVYWRPTEETVKKEKAKREKRKATKFGGYGDMGGPKKRLSVMAMASRLMK